MKKNSLFTMAATAMLLALVLVFTLTGLGLIPIGIFTLAVLLTLPVAVGAVSLGPISGAILGLAFGLASFSSCFSTDVLGMKFMAENPFLTAVMCIIPRVLCGLLPALLFQWLHKYDKQDKWSPYICCAATAVCNTVLFLGSMWIFFSDILISQEGIPSVWMLFVIFAGLNALLEIGVNFVFGGAISKILLAFRKRMHV